MFVGLGLGAGVSGAVCPNSRLSCRGGPAGRAPPGFVLACFSIRAMVAVWRAWVGVGRAVRPGD